MPDVISGALTSVVTAMRLCSRFSEYIVLTLHHGAHHSGTLPIEFSVSWFSSHVVVAVLAVLFDHSDDWICMWTSARAFWFLMFFPYFNFPPFGRPSVVRPRVTGLGLALCRGDNTIPIYTARVICYSSFQLIERIGKNMPHLK